MLLELWMQSFKGFYKKKIKEKNNSKRGKICKKDNEVLKIKRRK